VARSNQGNQAAAVINAKDLETLFDPIFAGQMEKLHIPGAAVSVVKDGKIVFTKGYGVADVEKKNPVIPDKTLFRIGSITYLFQDTYMVYEKVVEKK
jgi:CubicO group peptidase (beta-lactamase class C family)